MQENGKTAHAVDNFAIVTEKSSDIFTDLTLRNVSIVAVSYKDEA